MIRLKHTCRSATCFLIATLLDHRAQITIVMVDQRYVAKTIAKAGSAVKIPEATIASVMINTNVQDCTNIVNNNHTQKKNHGLISK